MIDFVILSLAVFRVTRFFVKDFLIEGLRSKFWERFPPESTKLGYFSTCAWCLGFWVSLTFYTCYTIMPLTIMWVSYVLALSTIVGWLTALDDRF